MPTTKVSPMPRAQIFCCGLFHYRNYVEKLVAEGCVEEFVFSHKISTYRGQTWAKNIWLKEYLIRLIGKMAPDSVSSYINPIIHDYWQMHAIRHANRAPIAHVMLPGISPAFIRKLKHSGAIVIGEAVNTHPDNHYRVIRDEGRLCGISMPEEMPLQWRRVRSAVTYCDWLLTPSSFVSRTFIERGFPAERIACLPYCANIADFSPPKDWTERRSRPLRVVCVAQVIPRKGIGYLIEAWRRLQWKPHEAQLRIVGRISHEMRGLAGQEVPGVEFVGTLDRNQVAMELRKASIFVLPTLEEGFACVILEAMAAGCSVITTTESGADGVIKSGDSGILVPPRNVDALQNALSALRDDPELRERMGHSALQSVMTKYNWQAYSDRLKDIYERMVDHEAS